MLCLQALNIEHTKAVIHRSSNSLFKRLCLTDSPTRNLCIHLLDIYMTDGILIPGTIIDRIVKTGISPLSLLSQTNVRKPLQTEDGLVDSLRSLLLCENYVKPWSDEYLLVKLLTKSF